VALAGKAGFAKADREKAVNRVATAADRVGPNRVVEVAPLGEGIVRSVTAVIVDHGGRNVANRLARCPS
jgi:hypothetical protein